MLKKKMVLGEAELVCQKVDLALEPMELDTKGTEAELHRLYTKTESGGYCGCT